MDLKSTAPKVFDSSTRIESGVQDEQTTEFNSSWLIKIIICVLFLAAFVLPIIVSDNNKGTHSMTSSLSGVSILALALVYSFLPSKDEKLSFLTFSKPGVIVVCGLLLVFVASVIYADRPTSSIPVLIAFIAIFLLLAYLWSHFTILNYKPFENNDKFRHNRTIHRQGNEIKIRESRPFQIVLENCGGQVTPLSGLSVERIVHVQRRQIFFRFFAQEIRMVRTGVNFEIPKDVVINPGQIITLIPGKSTTDNICSGIAISGFRCFGYNVGEHITTKLKKDNASVAEMEENFTRIGYTGDTQGFTSVTETVNTTEGMKIVTVK